MICALCGAELEPSFFGPVAKERWPCRGGYPLYQDNGTHVAAEEGTVPAPGLGDALLEWQRRKREESSCLG